jgi:hypothetical protein
MQIHVKRQHVLWFEPAERLIILAKGEKKDPRLVEKTGENLDPHVEDPTKRIRGQSSGAGKRGRFGINYIKMFPNGFSGETK